MQEALKKVTNDATEPIEKSVTLCLQLHEMHLSGIWTWEMQSPAVYCSDVMSFPEEFIGTKGIIHPDDLANLKAALTLLEEKDLLHLDFRLITTYGEVKTISGQRVSIDDPKKDVMEPVRGKEPWEEFLRQLAEQRENDFLQLRKQLAEYTERIHGIGSWVINRQSGRTWYSDNNFQIYGLPPQTLNAHANTFNRFIYKEDRIPVLDAFEKAYKEQAPLHIEYRIVRADGKVRNIQQITRWFYGVNGQEILGGIIRDVTAERLLADALLAEQAQVALQQQVLKISEHQTSTGYWITDLATRKTHYSENYYRIYGFKQPFLSSNNSFLNLVHSDDCARVHEHLERMYNERSLSEIEFRIVRPDGKQRYIKQSGKLFISPNKELMMIGLVQDVTIQKGLEKKIIELNENISLSNAVADMWENVLQASSFTWLPDGYMQWSDGFYRMLGYKPGSIESLPRFLYKNIHPDDLKTFKEAEALLLNQQSHDDIVIRLVSKGGMRKVRMSFGHVNYGKDVIIGLVYDISKQNEILEQFANNESFTELLRESVNDMVIFTNIDNTILHWNKVAEEKAGIKKNDALYQNLFDVLPQLKEENFLVQIHAAIKGNEAHSARATSVYLKRPHDYRLWPLKDETGEVTGVLHVVQDVSKQLELQQQLHKGLNFIENLVESSVDRIVVLDRFMNYLYWNKKAEEYYGINKDRVLGKNILEVFPFYRNEVSFNEFRKVLRGETIYLPAVEAGEGDEYFETYLTPIKDDTGDVTAVLWVVHDLSREWQLTKERARTTNLLQATMDASTDMIQVFEAVRNEEGDIIDFKWILTNHEAEKQMGDVVGESLLKQHPGVLEEGIFETFRQLVETGLPAQNERHYVHEQFNGWFYQSVVKLNDGVATTTRDITLRKKAEEENTHLRDLLRSVFDASLHGIILFRAVRNNVGAVQDYEVVLNNAVTKSWNGRDLTGSLYGEVFPDIRKYGILDAYNKVLETGEPVKLELKYENHDFKNWFVITAVKLNGDELVATAEDITERKNAEEELRNKLTILQYTEQMAQTGSWEYEIMSGEFRWSEGMYHLFSLPQQMKVRPETYLDFAAEEDQSVAKRIVNSISKKHQSFEELLRIKRKGRRRLLKIKGTVIYDETGEALKLIGVDIDITDIENAEEKLRESRHWLEQTTKASPDSITVYDLQKKQPVYLNNCLSEWTGVSNKELIEMGVEGRLQLIHPDDRLTLLHHNEKTAAASDREVVTIEYRIKTNNGKSIWLRNRSKPFLRDASGKVTHILTVLQNVTEEIELREQLKQRTQFAEAIFDASIDRITVFDKDSRFVGWNKRCEQIHNRPKEEAIGKTIFELFPGIENYPQFIRAQELSLKGEFIHVPMVRDDYTGDYLELFYIPLKNEKGETYAVVNIMHNVSDYVVNTEQLNTLNRKLESKNIELEQKNEEITSFAFVASHDMKEPLRKIHTFSDWLLETESDWLSVKGKDIIHKISASVKRMEQLIDDILVLTKIHSDTHREEDVDLNSVLRQVSDEMTDRIMETGAIINTDELPVIRANSNQVFYLFKNLVSNAIKFQKPGSIPQISISHEIVQGSEVKMNEPGQQYLKLSFADNGFGFDQRYAKKIFQVFQRLHGKHEFEGTGIGLAICKKIMENHNGVIAVQSEQGKGSIFSCYFPLH